MKKYLMDLPIECWRHKGKLGHSEPCFCVAALPDQTVTLTSALQEVVTEEAPPAKRTVTLTSDQPNQIRRIRFHFVDANVDLRKLCLSQADDTLVLVFTPEAKSDVLDAFSAWIDGGEDFALFADGKRTELSKFDLESGELWFWSEMRP
jgi:hypothetical protein